MATEPDEDELELLRDLVRGESQHYDGCTCLVCRVRAFLFTEPGKRRETCSCDIDRHDFNCPVHNDTEG